MNSFAFAWASNIFFLLMLNSFLAPISAAQQDRSNAQALADFNRFYEQTLKEAGIVGSSVFLVHDNRVVNQDFYGLAKIDEQRKVDQDTIYHWASTTKSFTGIAIMQLRDRGLLRVGLLTLLPTTQISAKTEQELWTSV